MRSRCWARRSVPGHSRKPGRRAGRQNHGRIARFGMDLPALRNPERLFRPIWKSMRRAAVRRLRMASAQCRQPKMPIQERDIASLRLPDKCAADLNRRKTEFILSTSLDELVLRCGGAIYLVSFFYSIRCRELPWPRGLGRKWRLCNDARTMPRRARTS